MVGETRQQLTPTVAGAAPQATRWLLGRIKDGSQRFRLLQQAQCIYRGMEDISATHPECCTSNVSAKSGTGNVGPKQPQTQFTVGPTTTEPSHHATNTTSNRHLSISAFSSASDTKKQGFGATSKPGSRADHSGITKQAEPKKKATLLLRTSLPLLWQQHHQQQHRHEQQRPPLQKRDGCVTLSPAFDKRLKTGPAGANSVAEAAHGRCELRGLLDTSSLSKETQGGSYTQASPSMERFMEAAHLGHRTDMPRDAIEDQRNAVSALPEPIGVSSCSQMSPRELQKTTGPQTAPRGRSLQSNMSSSRRTSVEFHKGEEEAEPVAASILKWRHKGDSCRRAVSRLPHHGALFGNLSAEQRLVVDAPSESSVCVLAGPGSGKTLTLTARIVRLLVEGRRPLAALTFTKKAAAELERRIHGGLDGVLANPNSSHPVGELREGDLFVGTFHGFFMKLLRSHGGAVGVPNNFRVLGQFEQQTLLRTLIEREKRAQAQRHGVCTALFGNPQDSHVSSDEAEECSEDETETQCSFLEKPSDFSKTTREADELRKHIRSMKFIPELLQRERAAGSVLFRLFCEYSRHLKEQQPPLLDFTDLTVLAIRLLERGDTREQLRLLWPYLVIDEFQDTNSNQFKFLSLLSLRKPRNASSLNSSEEPEEFQLEQKRGGITVVGDDDQSIYKWRGTHIGIFHEFRRTFPDYREFFLSCNYRSVPVVVRHSLSLVSFNWPFRISKALYSVCQAPKLRFDVALNKGITQAVSAASGGRDGAESPSMEPTYSSGDMRGAFLPTQSLEAQYILRYILCLKQQHKLRWDDFAILCRTNSALADLQRLLLDPRIQRAACAASSQFATTPADGTAAPNKYPSEVTDPNVPLDPAVLFPAVDVNTLELPAGGLPVATTNFKKSGGTEIFHRPDVLDLLSYLRLAVDPHHDPSFVRVLNKPPRRIGVKTLLALKRVQKSLASHLADEVHRLSGTLEMPWQELRWVGQQSVLDARAKPSLFDAMCTVLRVAGTNPELFSTHFAISSATEAEAKRLRSNHLESLGSFAQVLHSLSSMSRSSRSVSEILLYVLGPLGLGSFFAQRRQTQRTRASTFHGSAHKGVIRELPLKKLESGENPISEQQPKPYVTPAGSKRKAERTKGAEDTGESVVECRGTGDAFDDLFKIYGVETFADVIALMRSVESYTPNWQQVTAADCILRLLRDAGSGRFLQKKLKNAVILSTVHQTKGLEWQAVIVARANEGTLPLGLGGSQPLADFVARVLSCSASETPTPEAIRRAEATIMRQAAGNEQYLHLMEERRVCYVALTRAKRFLLLTAPLADKSNHPLQPSRFFREASLVRQRPARLPAVPEAAAQYGRSATPAEELVERRPVPQ